jgi:hypothetical protein
MPAPGANLQVKPMVLAATNRNPVLLDNGGNGSSVPATVPAPGADLAMIVGPPGKRGGCADPTSTPMPIMTESTATSAASTCSASRCLTRTAKPTTTGSE